MKRLKDFLNKVLYEPGKVISIVEVTLEYAEPDGSECWLGADSNGTPDYEFITMEEK